MEGPCTFQEAIICFADYDNFRNVLTELHWDTVIIRNRSSLRR
jgi:hypothetical protein